MPGRNPNLTDHQATGSLGDILLKSLLSEPAFKVAILTRESSRGRTSIPPAARVITTVDSYPQKICFSVAEQLKFIDTAVAAGVKRYIPSEYGLDNNNFAARELSPVFRDKGRVQDYVRLKEDTGLTWTAIACGMWIGCSTANQIVILSDFATTQVELVETIERLTSETWRRESVDPSLAEGWSKGDTAAGHGLTNIGFTKGTYGGHFEPLYQLRNWELALPTRDLEGVVREALREVGHRDLTEKGARQIKNGALILAQRSTVPELRE
ncbi:hypothetical protein AN7154.2 [Aspergillus nidulans FGSC A4]|uniref:NmrA-like domain-containing protein n=1 Tax=Emericella nidulans (strain FGSC A4 / ATCC 38163 / CBS 112.46 / NRRL 194 / M139) TaxID=227321 RepID=Q5AX26_EMENI|nr:hypothetical protein [Aspergillus nidulans FGSC A4]EAA61406.1 hypothetical protein AN7154.2 [Aspergillus nidulans FGSC A4]CBF78968.1 TPA: hypothetical protein ANIA_07154 [Aspergillus nidulans FGSC A4]|eukprot:XP_664758.1 hypothetical protein AN7154.2 [Aspergillus nidulans FGSC A4]